MKTKRFWKIPNSPKPFLLEEFKKQNIQVIFTNQQFEDNAEGNLMLQIQAAVSEYERANILDRTRRGRKYAVKNGQMLGSMAPYGYRFMPKGDGKPPDGKSNPVKLKSSALSLTRM